MEPGRNSSKRKEFARLFMKRAGADLKSAKDLLRADDFADSVLHSQQCIEKAVKSHLILEDRFVSKHMVSDIYSKVIGKAPELDKVLESCEDMERHWLRPRYPFPEEDVIWDPLEKYKKEDAEDAIKKAELVYETLAGFIKEKYGICLEDMEGVVPNPAGVQGKNSGNGGNSGRTRNSAKAE